MKLNELQGGYRSKHIATSGAGSRQDPFILTVNVEDFSFDENGNLKVATAPFSLLKTARKTDLSSTAWAITELDATIWGWTVINPNTATVYLKVYATNAPIVGTTTPLAVIPVPGGNGTNPGIHEKDPDAPYRFCDGGLAIATVTGLADNSNTAPTSPLYCELVLDY